MPDDRGKRTLLFFADGRSIHTYRWVTFFASDFNVHLCTFDYSKEDKDFDVKKFVDAGVTVHAIDRKGFNKFLVPFRVRRLARKVRPDVVHGHYITHYGYLAALTGKRPLVLTPWGSDVLVEYDEGGLKKKQVAYALARGDLFTVDGENTAKKLMDLGIDADKIKRIYFGVDTKRFHPSAKDKGMYDELKNSPDDMVVINVRGFADVYDPETMLKAAALVLKKRKDVIFVMARESEDRKRYVAMAKEMGVESQFRFIGNIPSADLPKFFASSDIYVTTSLSDSGLAASTAEAMASGLPVISTRVGDIDLWVEEGKVGFIIEKGDHQALAENILRLLESEKMRLEMGSKARTAIENRQDREQEMMKMERIYYQLSEEKE